MKQFFLAAASLGLIGLLLFGKYKLATAKATGIVLVLAGFAFAASTTSQLDASVIKTQRVQ